ncbi:MAG TPA: TIGR02281 family clan AA aspartic protease [Sphingomonas sp.]|nr:TIGR02281 family clan AA aspartic protease [Sphingomonas sp.]
MTPHAIPHLGADTHLYLLIAIVAIVVALLLRIRLFRSLLNFAITAALVAVLIVVVLQRGRFDPYFSQLVSALHLGGQEVAGREVRIRMAPDGHFWARVSINGIRRRMLIDSGATLTALSSGTAEAAGLKTDRGLFPVVLNTTNGAITARTATLPELTLGDIVARDLPVVVSPAFGHTDVLGMNFLSMLKSWHVDGRTLVLEPHHPQPAA